MIKLAAHDINAFRTAKELSSSEPAQLKRTISELENRIIEQDSLIALQNESIESLAHKLKDREHEIIEIKMMYSKQSQRPNNAADDIMNSLEKEKLERANKNMEALIEDLKDGFWTLFSEQRQGLEDCLKALEKLPSAPETKSLYVRVKREWKSIEAAKKRNIITPVNALRQLADLERAVVTYMLGRPKLSLTTVEVFRAEVLMEAFVTDPKLKSLSTNDSIRTISAKEENKIYREQALRAMRRAALLFPDKVSFEKKSKAARLIKIMKASSGIDRADQIIITICYVICHCHNLLHYLNDLPGGKEIMEFVQLGELF